MIRTIFLLSLYLVSIYCNEPVLVITNTQSPQVQVSWSLDVGKMKDTQLYDMLARYYGAPRISTSEQLRIPIDLFERPSGLLLFSIDGLSSRELVRNDYKAFDGKLVDLEASNGNPYGVIGTVLSGMRENVRDGKSGNFYDAMRKVYGGKVMVSGSGSEEGAKALSPNWKNFGHGAKSHYWEPKIKSFVSVAGTSSYTIGISDFSSLMKDLGNTLHAEVDYDVKEHMVTIVRNEASVSYDLSSPEEEALFAELLFVVNMAHHPVDFLSFHFNSLVSIISKYGASSAEYNMAVQMIDAVIARIQSAYEKHANYETTIIYFPETYRSKEIVSAVETRVVNAFDEDVTEATRTEILSTFPHLFLHTAVKDSKFQELCSSLRTDLADYPVSVDCNTNLKRSLLQSNDTPTPEPSPEPAPAPPGPPGPPPGVASQQEIELVHIVLWLVIAMIAALVQACYHLSVLDGSNEPEFKAKNYEGAGIRSKTHKM